MRTDETLKVEDIVGELRTENERLQTVKRRALAIADERAIENERLRAALKPFADYADPTAVFPPTIEITQGSRLAKRQLTMGDCYEAARALEQNERE